MKVKHIDALRLLMLSFSIIIFVLFILYVNGVMPSGRQLVFFLVPLLTSFYYLSEYINDGSLYPRLGKRVNIALLCLFIVIPLFAGIRFFVRFPVAQYYSWFEYPLLDLILASFVLALVMEFSRREHIILFFINVFFIIYCLPWIGRLLPEPFFHLGLPLPRIVTSNTLEGYGAFGHLPLIGFFYVLPMLFFLEIVKDFGALRSLGDIVRVKVRRKSLLSPACIFSSAAIGVTTASITANVTVAGSFTIPTYKRLGFPPNYAGAIEVASSIGGLILPPIMSVVAFVMAGIMGVSYWEVVIHAWIIGLIYFAALVICVKLIEGRYTSPSKASTNASIEERSIEKVAYLYLGAFILALAVIIIYLGILGFEIPTAAYYGVITLLIYLLSVKIYEGMKHGLKRSLIDFIKCLLKGIEDGATSTCTVMLLIATLGIMVNVMYATGFIMDASWVLAGIAMVSPYLLIITAYFFGLLIGLGLPPTATYISMAVLFVPLMQKIGIDFWAAHFFAFLVACLAEFSPPASIAAAVASRMAGGSFYMTMLISSYLALPMWLFPFLCILYPQILTLTLEGILYGFIALMACLGLTARFLFIKERISRLSSILMSINVILGALIFIIEDITIDIIMATLVFLLLAIAYKKLK